MRLFDWCRLDVVAQSAACRCASGQQAPAQVGSGPPACLLAVWGDWGCFGKATGCEGARNELTAAPLALTAGLDWQARLEVVELLQQLKQQCSLLVVSMPPLLTPSPPRSATCACDPGTLSWACLL